MDSASQSDTPSGINGGFEHRELEDDMSGLEATVTRPLPDVEGAIRDALAKNGFGVLTEIDVAKTLEAKIGVIRPPMKILGACNPNFANRALELDVDAALWMPCNVVLEQVDDQTRISIVDPVQVMPGEDMRDVAGDARAALQAVLDEVTA